MLIDSGSTHNLIQPELAERLCLNVVPINAFKVYIGNGDYLVYSHKCPHVPVIMQGMEFPIDVYVLPIQGPDMVLGVQWLQELGVVAQDFAVLSMEFTWQGKRVELRGDSFLGTRQITFNRLQSLVMAGEAMEMYELYPLQKSEGQNAGVDNEFLLPEDLLG